MKLLPDCTANSLSRLKVKMLCANFTIWARKSQPKALDRINRIHKMSCNPVNRVNSVKYVLVNICLETRETVDCRLETFLPMQC